MSDPVLWSAAENTALPGSRILGRPGPVGGASIDTRSLQPGDLFFAIRGVAQDGHDHVRTALAKGAAAAVLQEGRESEFEGPLVVVPDVLRAMEDLGRAARARSDAAIVAVTGSVGKTGTKEALRLILSRFGETHAAAASFNNHWGVPLTLARLQRTARFGVFEIGMNHPNEIVPLTVMVRPHVAIVTTVEPVHIGHFRAIQGIADAKGEIFSGVETGGVAILPRDNPHFERLAAHAMAGRAGRIVSFGESEAADVRALRIATAPDASMVEAASHAPPQRPGEPTPLPRPTGQATLKNESFNANPASMRAAHATLALTEPGSGGRRIAVLADMGELGEMGPDAHRSLVHAVTTSGADIVFAAGPLMRGLWDELPPRIRGEHTEKASDLDEVVAGAVRPGDVVMVKGSKYTLVSKVAAHLKSRFGAPDSGAQRAENARS